MNKLLFFSLAFVLLAGAGCAKETSRIDQYSQTPEPPKAVPQIIEFPKSGDATSTPKISTTTSMTSEDKKSVTYVATLHTTEGDIEITLNNDETPKTVENFVTLSKKDFYNGTIFHRVMKGFMIQGGDPENNGTGGPGYTFDDERFTGSYVRGAVAMANRGKNTNGSQFFIMHADYPLPKNYTIFGHVTKGMDVVDKIATAKVEMSRMGEMSKPLSPVTVESIDIVEK